MYRIKMLCYDYGNPTPYEDEPENAKLYNAFEDAYNAAFDMAEEVEYLNSDCDELTSFGIVQNEEDNTITVNCYMLANENDTTGITEIVTVYYIERTTKYRVGFYVDGCVDVLIEATSVEEAEKKAKEYVCEMDFGELNNIEWEQNIETEEVDEE